MRNYIFLYFKGRQFFCSQAYPHEKLKGPGRQDNSGELEHL